MGVQVGASLLKYEISIISSLIKRDDLVVPGKEYVRIARVGHPLSRLRRWLPVTVPDARPGLLLVARRLLKDRILAVRVQLLPADWKRLGRELKGIQSEVSRHRGWIVATLWEIDFTTIHPLLDYLGQVDELLLLGANAESVAERLVEDLVTDQIREAIDAAHCAIFQLGDRDEFVIAVPKEEGAMWISQLAEMLS